MQNGKKQDVSGAHFSVEPFLRQQFFFLTQKNELSLEGVSPAPGRSRPPEQAFGPWPQEVAQRCDSVLMCVGSCARGPSRSSPRRVGQKPCLTLRVQRSRKIRAAAKLRTLRNQKEPIANILLSKILGQHITVSYNAASLASFYFLCCPSHGFLLLCPLHSPHIIASIL